MHLEPRIEDFLLRIAPDLGATWEGSPQEEIDQIAELSGCLLPPFYRWFLSKMGRSMGTFSNGNQDLSALTVLSLYRDGSVSPDPRYLAIGYDHDEVMPMHIFYDLEKEVRDDAAVFIQPVDDTSSEICFETLREMLGWNAMQTLHDQFPQRCEGTFSYRDGDVLSQISPLIELLGFKQPISTGAFCGLFERHDASISAMVPPDGTPKSYIFFDIGTFDAATIQEILDKIRTDPSLNIEVSSWAPPLS